MNLRIFIVNLFVTRHAISVSGSILQHHLCRQKVTRKQRNNNKKQISKSNLLNRKVSSTILSYEAFKLLFPYLGYFWTHFMLNLCKKK